MREILFKAKRKDNGKWVEGDAIHEPIGMSIRHEKNGMSVRVPVDPDTLCQYTGLTDKNGQKIWENDIVRNEEGDIGVVQWFEEHAAFMIWNKTKNCVCYLAENDFSKIEIVGNEFDNPELLEVE
jgi:uncharacterized phage protein (TIGR01671 family)|nr:MAG TPA: YopX protein [Siphoviridae sp. ctdzB12]